MHKPIKYYIVLKNVNEKLESTTSNIKFKFTPYFSLVAEAHLEIGRQADYFNSYSLELNLIPSSSRVLCIL